MKGKTVIYCAHRLSSIVGVDKIHVVGDGKVQEQGSHQDLIGKEGSKYGAMWKNQQVKPFDPDEKPDGLVYKFEEHEH